MKKILFTLILVVGFGQFSSAQGNLQFNRVVNGEFVTVVDYVTTSMGSITVPVGKVWKVESVSLTSISSGARLVNGNPVYFGNHCVKGASTATSYLPLWLSPGTYDVTAIGSNNLMTFNYSIIEFNVVP